MSTCKYPEEGYKMNYEKKLNNISNKLDALAMIGFIIIIFIIIVLIEINH